MYIFYSVRWKSSSLLNIEYLDFFSIEQIQDGFVVDDGSRWCELGINVRNPFVKKVCYVFGIPHSAVD